MASVPTPPATEAADARAVDAEAGPRVVWKCRPVAVAAAPRPGVLEILGGLSWVDRLLPLWIFLAMVLGVLLSVFVDSVHTAFDGSEWEGVPVPLVVGLIVMIVPPFCGVRWEVLPRLLRLRSVWRDVAMSCALNYVAGPFLMLALAWATLPDLEHYRTGITLVGLARCIGMVLVWNQIARGDPELCALLVVLNSAAQLVLYAPMAVLFVKVISGADADGIGYATVARSVGVYLGIPLAAGAAVRAVGIALLGRDRYHARAMPFISPWALVGLVYTIVVIFAQQGNRVIHNLGPVFRTFVPLTLYFFIMWTGTFLLSRWVTRSDAGEGVRGAGEEGEAAGPPEDEDAIVKHCGYDKLGNCCDSDCDSCVPSEPEAQAGPSYATAVTQAFTASSNNFELSIAVATAVYGVGSSEALAATIGALLEVPVLLALSYVALVLRAKLRWRDVGRALAGRAGAPPPPA